MKTRDTLLNQEIPVIVINVILGVATINLPSRLARSAGADGIIAFIAASCIALIAAFLIVCLVMRFPDQGFAEYSPKLVGVIPGFILNILLTMYFLYGTAVVLRTFSDTAKVFLLPRTPLEVIMISMLFTAAVLARNGLQPIARSCQIILFLFFVPLLLLPFFISIFDFGEFLPLFQTDFHSMMKAAIGSIFALTGAEVLLVIGSHVHIKRGFMRLTLLGVLTAAALTLLIVSLTFGSLSVEQTAKLQDPIFEMIKYLPVPVLFIERGDLFIFGIWIVLAYSTILILLFTLSHHLAETFKVDSSKNFVIPAAVAIYYLAKIPVNDIEIERFGSFFNIGWLILVFGIVPLFLLLSYIRKQGQPLLAKSEKKEKKRKANP